MATWSVTILRIPRILRTLHILVLPQLQVPHLQAIPRVPDLHAPPMQP